MLAFALSALFSALAGGIHAYWITFLDPASAFDITLNVKMIIMAVFGGPGTVFGPVVGAFMLSAISEVLANEISTLAEPVLRPGDRRRRGASCRAAWSMSARRFRTLGWRYFAQNIRAHRL